METLPALLSVARCSVLGVPDLRVDWENKSGVYIYTHMSVHLFRFHTHVCIQTYIYMYICTCVLITSFHTFLTLTNITCISMRPKSVPSCAASAFATHLPSSLWHNCVLKRRLIKHVCEERLKFEICGLTWRCR